MTSRHIRSLTRSKQGSSNSCVADIVGRKDKAMTKAERILLKIELKLMMKHGVDETARLLDPLKWYIVTARASVDFIRRLGAEEPEVIAHLLEQEGSVEDTVNRIKAHLYK